MRDASLTDQQAAFVLHFTSTPGAIGNASEAARRAGYSERNPGELGRQALEKPHVRAAIDDALRREISGPMAAKASAFLGRVVDDEAAPLKCRIEAAKTILDRAGILAPSVAERVVAFGRRNASAKAIQDMTIAELEADGADLGRRAETLRAIIARAETRLMIEGDVDEGAE